jgi:Holliday junction DNA helicase RuvA
LIVGIEGVISGKNGNSLFLTTNGITYEIFSSLFDIDEVQDGQVVYLHTHQIFRENSVELFGFFTIDSRELFKELIKISGVGPKVALAILSTLSKEELIQIIETEDENALTVVPKIGLKSAKKILNELIFLKEKLHFSGNIASGEKAIAIDALEQLGFAKKSVIKAVENIEGSHQEIIKEALKRL